MEVVGLERTEERKVETDLRFASSAKWWPIRRAGAADQKLKPVKRGGP